MEDLQPFGDEQLDFGHDALSILCFVTWSLPKLLLQLQLQRYSAKPEPKPGMLIAKKTGVYCDLSYFNILKFSALTSKVQDLQEAYSLDK